MMRLPPLRLLVVFEAVQRLGSLQRAAAELNVSSPAISQALRGLEAHLGHDLMDRSTRPACLTEAGTLLLAAVREGLGRIAEALTQIEALGRQRAVTIAAPIGTATYWLMPRLAGLYAEAPELSVHVRTTADGAPALTPGVDLAIRYGATGGEGLAEELFQDSVVPVCRPDLAHLGLACLSLIHVDAAQQEWMGWDGYLAKTGLTASTTPGRHFTNYVQATQAALAGQGVMLGWESNTGWLVKESALAPLNVPRLVPTDSFWLVTAPSRAADAHVRRVANWLRA